MLPNRPMQRSPRQRGFATLTMTIIILFLITLVVLYAGKTAVFEQDIAANQFRAAQALAAANAGMDYALAYAASTGMDVEPDGTADCNFANKYENDTCNITVTDPDDNQSLSFTFFYCAAAPTRGRTGEQVITDAANCGTPALKGAKNLNAVVAIGYSDDRAARRILMREVEINPFLANGPAGPLSARAAIGLTGNMTIINRYNTLSIWTGEPATTWGSAETYLRPPAYQQESPEECKKKFPSSKDPKFRCYCSGGTCLDHTQLVTDAVNNNHSDSYSNKQVGSNMDVITDDPNLRSPKLSADQLFQAIFGRTKAQYEAAALAAGQRYAANAIPNTVNKASGPVWIEGNVKLNGGTYGSVAAPMAVVVNGNMDSQGNITIIGLLYVIGQWDTAGTVVVQGAAVVEGSGGMDGKGTTKVVYDPVALENLDNPRDTSLNQGTWRDW